MCLVVTQFVQFSVFWLSRWRRSIHQYTDDHIISLRVTRRSPRQLSVATGEKPCVAAFLNIVILSACVGERCISPDDALKC